MTDQLSRTALKFFESRGISLETVLRHGIYSESHGATGSDAIVFPFIEGDTVVNRKYRGRDKRFWQDKGGRKTLWNADVLDDPALQDGTAALVITEGEIDALTGIEHATPYCVSVPEGAPEEARSADEEIVPAEDLKFKFLWNNWDRLKRIKRFVLAVDGDTAGLALRDELVRRLGAVRCLFVTWPEGTKDLNEVLLQFGPEMVKQVLVDARPYPVKGLYTLQDYPEEPRPNVLSTGMRFLDLYIRPYLGSFWVVTGVPNHGKSTFVNAVVLEMARMYRWRIGMASFEMPPVPYMRDEIRAWHIRDDDSHYWAADAIREADQFIEDHVVFLGSAPREEEDEISVEWIIDKAEEAVIRYGIKVLVLDPWNEVEHKRRQGETETEYTGRAIRALKRFARSFNVMVVVVAHPTKLQDARGVMREPSLYDISGSANWANKADFGIVIWRPHLDQSVVEVKVKKVRFRWAGKAGVARCQYSRRLSAFEDIDDELEVA